MVFALFASECGDKSLHVDNNPTYDNHAVKAGRTLAEKAARGILHVCKTTSFSQEVSCLSLCSKHTMTCWFSYYHLVITLHSLSDNHVTLRRRKSMLADEPH